MEKQIIEYLWQIIDDIDTASDIAKSNDISYRNMVEKLQKKRWNTKITTNGYKLDLTKMEVPETKPLITPICGREGCVIVVYEDSYYCLDHAYQHKMEGY